MLSFIFFIFVVQECLLEGGGNRYLELIYYICYGCFIFFKELGYLCFSYRDGCIKLVKFDFF